MCQEGQCIEHRTASVCSQCGVVEGDYEYCDLCKSVYCTEEACAVSSEDHEHHQDTLDEWLWEKLMTALDLDEWTWDWAVVRGRHVEGSP